MFSFENQGNFDRLTLIIACIMLSDSRPVEKLKAFFEIFDEGSIKLLNANEIRKMLEIMFQVSTYNALFLGYGTDTNHLNETQIKEYSQSFNILKERFVSEFLIIILLDQFEIGMQRFLDIMGKGNYSKIFYPSGLREYLIQFKS